MRGVVRDWVRDAAMGRVRDVAIGRDCGTVVGRVRGAAMGRDCGTAIGRDCGAAMGLAGRSIGASRAASSRRHGDELLPVGSFLLAAGAGDAATVWSFRGAPVALAARNSQPLPRKRSACRWARPHARWRSCSRRNSSRAGEYRRDNVRLRMVAS